MAPELGSANMAGASMLTRHSRPPLVWLAALSRSFVQFSRLVFIGGLVLGDMSMATVVLFAYLEVSPNRVQPIHWLVR